MHDQIHCLCSLNCNINLNKTLQFAKTSDNLQNDKRYTSFISCLCLGDVLGLGSFNFSAIGSGRYPLGCRFTGPSAKILYDTRQNSSLELPMRFKIRLKTGSLFRKSECRAFFSSSRRTKINASKSKSLPLLFKFVNITNKFDLMAAILKDPRGRLKTSFKKQWSDDFVFLTNQSICLPFCARPIRTRSHWRQANQNELLIYYFWSIQSQKLRS